MITLWIALGILIVATLLGRVLYKKGWKAGTAFQKKQQIERYKNEFKALADEVITDIAKDTSYDPQYDVSLLKSGSRIHINSIRGIYEVISFVKNASITISCRKWEEMFRANEIGSPVKTVSWSDFKCFEGKKKEYVPQSRRLHS